MIREITKYPNPPSVEFAVDVRVFDEELSSFIDDLKDTIDEHNLDGLASTQVGSYLSVVVVKDNDKFLELINPRILNKKGSVETIEKTAYYGDNGCKITRYDSISLIYEDRDAKQHSLKTDGALSIVIQRKIDYLFGVNFTSKLSDEQKVGFESSLGDKDFQSCPTTNPKGFSRDWFVHLANFILAAMLLLFVSSFFIEDNKTLSEMWGIQLYSSFLVVGVNIAYSFYSYFENKRFSICTNCYNMSIFGVVMMSIFRLSMIMIASYLMIK